MSNNVVFNPFTSELYFDESGSGSPGGSNLELQYNNAGAFEGDPFLAVNTTDSALVMNGLQYVQLSNTVVLANNSAAVTFSFPKAYNFVVIEYSIGRDSNKRAGRFLIVNNGATVSMSDDYIDLEGNIGVSFSAVVNGANIDVSHLVSNNVFGCNFKYTLRRWQE